MIKLSKRTKGLAASSALLSGIALLNIIHEKDKTINFLNTTLDDLNMIIFNNFEYQKILENVIIDNFDQEFLLRKIGML